MLPYNIMSEEYDFSLIMYLTEYLSRSPCAYSQALAAMQSPRAYGAAASVGGNIFVAGGMTENYQNDTIEVFNASSFTWAELVPPLERKRQRAFLTACVLSSS